MRGSTRSVVWGVAGTIAAAALMVAGCGTRGDDRLAVIGAPPSTSSVAPIPPSTTAQAVDDPEGGEHPAQFAANDQGVVLPDGEFTPGAVFDDVRSDDVCDIHYSQSVRQPRFNDKVEAFARYGISIHDRDVYVVDHLVPVVLGGTNALENLWPQPNDGAASAAAKNVLEQELHAMVCGGDLTLEEAQHAVSADWWRAYETYVGPMDVSPVTEPEPATSSTDSTSVANGSPCAEEGAIGYTEPKRVPLRCIADEFGRLTWQKRYS